MGESYKSADDFIARLEAGEFDSHLFEAIGSLSPPQLTEVALRVIERNRKLLREAKLEKFK